MNIRENSSLSQYIATGCELLFLNVLLYVFSNASLDIFSCKSIFNPYYYVIFNLSYLLSIGLFRFSFHIIHIKSQNILGKIIKTYGCIFLLLVTCFEILGTIFKWETLIIFFICQSSLAFILRMVLRAILLHKHKQEICSAIIIGSGSIAKLVYDKIILNKMYSYKFCGFFDDEKYERYFNSDLYKGTLDDVVPFLKEHKIDEIFCALPSGKDRKTISVLNYAENHLIRFYYIPDFKRFLNRKVSLRFVHEVPLISSRNEPLELVQNKILKRAFDIIVSLIFLCTIFPIIFIIIGIAIKMESRGKIFFVQKRTGLRGKEFNCLKFRSMMQNDEADVKQATKDDARVTHIGKFLRKSNLDELPQFINVLLGQMTIVGPRPHMIKQTEEYSALVDRYMLRHQQKPGITGLAQVSGYRGEIKNIQELQNRLRLDVWHLEHWSIWLDLKICLQTIKLSIIGDKKAY